MEIFELKVFFYLDVLAKREPIDGEKSKIVLYVSFGSQ